MNWQLKKFEELSLQELYDILRLRAEVFVVEQDCIYQDLDDWDQKAYHLFAEKEGNIIAYSRLFLPNIKIQNHSSIGRVVVSLHSRNQDLGKELMKKSIHFLQNAQPSAPICISAQTYLERFYTGLGFKKQGDTYLEDGIPHQKMIF